MKSATQVRDLGIAQALIKGACPICALLKEFQSEFIYNPESAEVNRLCNYHAWAIAHGTPGRIAVNVFAKALEVVESGADGNRTCDVCCRIYEEEEIGLRELAKELASRTTLTDWMLRHGSICLNHANKLKPFLPVRLQGIVDRIVQRHIAELKQEVDVYRQQVKQGTNSGWGALGKVAELLVSQRGITR